MLAYYTCKFVFDTTYKANHKSRIRISHWSYCITVGNVLSGNLDLKVMIVKTKPFLGDFNILYLVD